MPGSSAAPPSRSPAGSPRSPRLGRSSPTGTRRSDPYWSIVWPGAANTPTSSPRNGPTSFGTSGAAEDARAGDARLPPLDSQCHRREPALRPVRPRDRHRQRQSLHSPSRPVVRRGPLPRPLRGRHGGGLPGRADRLCPLPQPPVREVQPGRLLRPRRLFRPGRPEGGTRNRGAAGR